MIVRNLVVQSANKNCFSEKEIQIISKYVNNKSPLTNAKMNELEQKVMQLYKPDIIRVSSLPPNAVFILKNGLKMKFLRKIRKYYECIELKTGKRYRVNPDAEVQEWKSE